MAGTIEKRWLTPEEAQDYLGVGKTTLEELRRNGKLHPSKTTKSRNNGRVRYDTRDLDDYMESMRIDSMRTKSRARRQGAK